MYSLHLACRPEEAEQLSFALWEAGTVGIRELDDGELVELVAGFQDTADRGALSAEFAPHGPSWELEADTDWVAETERAWPARLVGERIFLAPVWNLEQTPPGRVRVIHNPGGASGTGEHPCTQLALESLERRMDAGSVVVDVGTGSGILAVTALRLGARAAVGLDLDLTSLESARENFQLNKLRPSLVAGTADCIASQAAHVLVANISGTVLLSIADELLRILSPGGWLILTGFPQNELATLRQAFGNGEVSQMNEWRCLSLQAG